MGRESGAVESIMGGTEVAIAGRVGGEETRRVVELVLFDSGSSSDTSELPEKRLTCDWTIPFRSGTRFGCEPTPIWLVAIFPISLLRRPGDTEIAGTE